MLRNLINKLTGKYHVIQELATLKTEVYNLQKIIIAQSAEIKQIHEKLILHDIEKAIFEGYAEGTAFYRTEINNEGGLQNWVLKENYF